jgi:methyl-accepting chemotaxis protein
MKHEVGEEAHIKRFKIIKVYIILWLFIYSVILVNFDTIKMFFLSTLTFNLAVVAITLNGLYIVMSGAIELILLGGTFGILEQNRSKEDNAYYLNGIDRIFPKSIADMLLERKEKSMLYFTQEEAERITDTLYEKFSNLKGHINFFVSAALMIGLLGTFTGLIQAVDDMGEIILSLSGDEIDLKQLMADFSGPLGGMAVGFGSSIFGVIAALLLGIKSFILYRNQEELLVYVGDWLRVRTVETDVANSDEETIKGRPHFMDIFVEHTGALKDEIAKISVSEEKIALFGERIARIDDNIAKKREILASLETNYNEQTAKAQGQLAAIIEQNQTIRDEVQGVQSLKEDIGTLDQKVQSSGEKLTTLEDDYKQSSRKLDEGFRVVDAIKDGVATLFHRSNATDEKITILDDKSAAIGKKLSSIGEIESKLDDTIGRIDKKDAEKNQQIAEMKKDIGFVSYSIDGLAEKFEGLSSDVLGDKEHYREIMEMMRQSKDENITTLLSLQETIGRMKDELGAEVAYIKKVGELQKSTSQKTLETHKNVLNLQNSTTTMIKALKASHKTTGDIYEKLNAAYDEIGKQEKESPSELKQSMVTLAKYGAILQENLKKELKDLEEVKTSIARIDHQINDIALPKKSDIKLEQKLERKAPSFFERVFLGKR